MERFCIVTSFALSLSCFVSQEIRLTHISLAEVFVCIWIEAHTMYSLCANFPEISKILIRIAT